MTGRAFRFFYFLEVALFLLAIWIDVTTTHAQFSPYSNTPFINIDCGRSEPSYRDEIGLEWVSDATYVFTGENSNESLVVDSSFANHKALINFRYFPGSSKSNCYLLPTQSQTSSLIRAMFYHGNSTILQLPIKFRVLFNSTYWFTLQYEADALNTDLNSPKVFEAVIYNPGSTITLCLVPTIGISFISSLEVRALAPEMYPFPGNTNAFLYKLTRLNTGAHPDSPPVRFPEDPYDRLWDSPSSTDWTGTVNQSYTNSTVNAFNYTPNSVPLKVMQDAWMYDNVHQPVFLSWGGLSRILNNQELRSIYTVLYAQEISPNSSANHIRIFDALLNHGEPGSYLTMPVDAYGVRTGYFSNYPTISDGAKLSLAIDDTVSALGPILNAVEIYAQVDVVTNSTLQQEVDTLDSLSQCVNLTHFKGDPCFPVPWDYVGCNYNYEEYLSGYAPDGSVIMYSFFTGLTSFECANKESNLKSGLTNLAELTIVNSEINFTSLQSIVKLIKPNDGNITRSLSLLNLSNNSQIAVDVNEILGEMFTFDGSLSPLIDLELSDNSLTGTFPEAIFSLQSLQTAYFDRNQINGTLNLTNWYNWLQSVIHNSSDPQNVMFSFLNNNITAIYPDVNILEPVITIIVDSSFEYRVSEDYVILLGGNPWCQTAENSLTQQYLCRFSSHDIIIGRKKSNTLAIALGSSGGAVGLLVICLLLAFLYKMRKQVREIHQVLAERKVQPPYFSYSELKSATKNFHHENKLGSGGFGAVYKGVLEDKTLLAVKKLFNSDQVLNEFLNEMVLITGIKHRNLVQLKGCCIEGKQRILVYEYVENGNLEDALWGNPTFKNPTLPWSDRFNIIVGIARGLAYLHEELQPGIIHRDIKPANVLLDKDCNAKIADFGLARSYFEEQTRENYTSIAGTRGYFAPEYATDGRLTEKADVYSFGIMILEILSGRKCIDYKQPEDKVFLKEWAQRFHMEGRVFEIVQLELREKGVHDQVTRAINIAFLCLQTLHTRRPSMSHVVTMLLGDMDVTIFLEKPQTNLLEFRSILNPILNPTSTLAKVNENEENPLLNVDFSLTSRSLSASNQFELSDYL